ncbi:MAG: tRNA (N6-isopentenyl adenosine(37)-C2)-methylthiotransferase MiaB [Oscillospiraceae bacterium]|nr:tRNA (N6-isopentenyl adenosine(37)-C2)-methylthiotransferase MiaB [Oscillospiraceae bacterium]
MEKVAQKVREIFHDRLPKAHVHSFGCQQNVSDSEKLAGMIANMGYGFTDDPKEADLVIYNTCAVREHAELKLFGNVGALKASKKKNPRKIIGLCGCMMQQDHIAKKIKGSFPYVDLVFGTHALQNFPEILLRHLTEEARVFDTEEEKNIICEYLPVLRDGNIKAWVPIMYGCNNFCTYCVVPYVRGREVSRKSADILEEVRGLVKDGYKEITLLGQNVNSYGRGLEEQIDFADLLQMICDIEGDFRVRFMTPHPKDITKKVIDTIARNDKLCNLIHLPVQSGNDRVLKEMNRKYTRADYLNIINYAKEKIPGVMFTSDIIVGFPGETYEEFCDTLSLIREVGYQNLFTFIYSKRVGTVAANMDDPVSREEKVKWFTELGQVQTECGKERYSQMLGTTTRVLIEGDARSGPDYVSGRDEYNRVVDVKGDKSLIGQLVNVKITKVVNWAAVAEII